MTPLVLVCDIIQTQLGMEDDQVLIYDQKWDVPTDDRMYIVAGMLAAKPFGQSRVQSPDGVSEELSINMQGTISLDIYSRTTEAFDRKEEVLMALKSTYAIQSQEANSFKLATIPTSMNDLSQIEGPAIPYRFNVSVNVQYLVTKTGAIQYYDTFLAAQVIDDAPPADVTDHGGNTLGGGGNQG